MGDAADPPLPAIPVDVEYRMRQTVLSFVPTLVHESEDPLHPSETRYHELPMTLAHLSQLLEALPEETQEALLGPFLADVEPVMTELATVKAERDALAAKLAYATMCIEHVRGYLEVQRSQADILQAVRITLEEYDRALRLDAAGKGGA